MLLYLVEWSFLEIKQKTTILDHLTVCKADFTQKLTPTY